VKPPIQSNVSSFQGEPANSLAGEDARRIRLVPINLSQGLWPVNEP
jgi:hypothetical protein